MMCFKFALLINMFASTLFKKKKLDSVSDLTLFPLGSQAIFISSRYLCS